MIYLLRKGAYRDFLHIIFKHTTISNKLVSKVFAQKKGEKSYDNSNVYSDLGGFRWFPPYYSKFLSNFSTMLAPLYRLLQKQTKWIWDAEQDKAFHEAKTHLTSECLRGYALMTHL